MAASVGTAVLLGWLVVEVIDATGRPDAGRDALIDSGIDLGIDGPAVPRPTPTGPPTCTPSDCGRWHAGRLSGERAIAVDAQLLVRAHEHPETGQALVEARDVTTGQLRWTVPVPAADPDAPVTPSSLEVRDDRIVLGFSASDDHPARLVAVSSDDGAVLVDAALDMVRTVVATTWRDGHGIVYGTATPSVSLEGSPRSLLVGVDDAGEVAWQLDGWAVPELELDVDPLLVRGDGVVAGLDPSSGRLRWEHAAGSGSVRGERAFIAVDRVGGHVRRLDPTTGAVLTSVGFDGDVDADTIERALPIGPWIGIVADGELTIHRRVAGADDVLDRHEAAGPVAAVAVDDWVVVAIGDQQAGRVDVVSYRRDGTAEPPLVLQGIRDVRPMELHAADSEDDTELEPGTVEVVLDHGGTLVRLHPRDGLLVRWQRFLGGTGDVTWHEGITAIDRGDGRLRLHGPGAVLVVDGADRLVSRRPLVAAGQGGVIVLDGGPLGDG